MKMRNHRILIAVTGIILLALFSLYFIFPGILYRTIINRERSKAGLVQKSMDVGEWHIEYLEGGQGDVLVLLHGFGGDKDHWTRMARFLTPYFRVIAPDLPGFGESSRHFKAMYTYTAQVDRLHQFMGALGIGKFHLAGNSMGGAIAGTYAARHENELISLWLIAPAGIKTAQKSELRQRLESGEPNPLIVGSTKDYDRLMDFVFVKTPYIPGTIKRYFANQAIHHSPLNKIISRQIKTDDDFTPLEESLQNSKMRALILWGDSDRVLHVSGANVLESAMHSAKSIIMNKVGHVPMLEKPQESAKIFINFWGEEK
jgi:pimeloyl-ACP methyl ester carboxylesterase